MKKLSRYFKLREQKIFKDGHFVEAGKKLLYICGDKTRSLFKTIDDTNIIRIFWSKEDDVVFVEEILEEWEDKDIEMLNKEITGNWI